MVHRKLAAQSLCVALVVAFSVVQPIPAAVAVSPLGLAAIQRHSRLVTRSRSHRGCNYLKGSWVDTSTIPGYSPPYSASCSQFSCDGAADGRKNPASFVWQPFPPCSYQLWRMQPRVLLERYRNSVIAFVGDSLNDNLVDSFKCTLAAVTPFQHMRLRVGGRRYRKAVVLPAYNLTLVTIASGKLTRLVNTSSARVRVDGQWAALLPRTAAMVFTAGHWFFHQNFMSPVLKLRKSLKAVRDYIECTNYPGVPLFVSFSPAHDRTQCKAAGTPLNNITTAIQVGDIRAMESLKEQRKLLARSRMRLVEITYMSMLRPDGHLNRGMSGRRKDCSHWCLPGVPDAWSDVIYSMLVA
ncbi:unnamed protein product [Closterium sp. Yama58-4]|nr:unnamed protein product [Closterium sp. Yama58-4]